MLPLLLFSASLVTDVRELIARHDFAGAERIARTYQNRSGANSTVAEALSWLGRGALQSGDLDRADAFASETRKLSTEIARTRGWDAGLVVAIGAAVEVHAQVLAARGARSEAVSYLRSELSLFRGSPIHDRIQKNINLLSLEGKAAPPLDSTDWLGSKPPSLAALHGKPVLLFFWAHWCSDCKAMGPHIASIARRFGEKLQVVAPTRLYGYAAGGEEAPPASEKKYIERVRQQYYAPLAGVPIPLSERNFLTYGSSTTPTIVLIDANGIVRLYHPGVIDPAELATRIQKLTGK
jgi:thiol-disulfide isomerase/thioredoxin